MNRARHSASARAARPLFSSLVAFLRRIGYALAAAACALPACVSAADYPERQIRIVVPYVPGGAADISARIIAQRLSERFNSQVVVENRTGGGGNIGALAVARAAPDGYTLLLATVSTAVDVTLLPKLEFDVLRDFEPVSLFTYVPLLVVVHPSVPVKTIGELIAFAKANPAKLNYASAGIGTGGHLAGELFSYMAGIKLVHIPYKGGAQSLGDTLAGHVGLLFNSAASSLGFVKQNKLRALAITGDQRSPLLPNVPTVAESGLPGYSVGGWYGILARAGTPAPILATLSSEIGRVARLPDVREKLLSQGSEPIGSTPEEFGRFLRAEISKWAKVVKASGMRAE